MKSRAFFRSQGYQTKAAFNVVENLVCGDDECEVRLRVTSNNMPIKFTINVKDP